MTDFVFKPEKAGVENGKNLYRAYMNRKPIDLYFRAHNAGEADDMFQWLFEHQTHGKTINFELNDYVKGYSYEKKRTAEEPKQDSQPETQEAGHPETAEGDKPDGAPVCERPEAE